MDEALPNMCKSTVAGWLWYCDVHDTHGNATTAEEALAMTQAHIAFWSEDKSLPVCDVYTKKIS